jgi:hypothetical protein
MLNTPYESILAMASPGSTRYVTDVVMTNEKCDDVCDEMRILVTNGGSSSVAHGFVQRESAQSLEG